MKSLWAKVVAFGLGLLAGLVALIGMFRRREAERNAKEKVAQETARIRKLSDADLQKDIERRVR